MESENSNKMASKQAPLAYLWATVLWHTLKPQYALTLSLSLSFSSYHLSNTDTVHKNGHAMTPLSPHHPTKLFRHLTLSLSRTLYLPLSLVCSLFRCLFIQYAANLKT